jgi:hypothetical protein
MFAAQITGLQTVAFGDLSTETWGTVVIAAPAAPLAILGAPDGCTNLEAHVDGSTAEEDWRITADAVELSITAAGKPAEMIGTDAARAGFDQVCRVSGRFTLEGDERAITTLGVRGVRAVSLVTGGFEVVREVAAWFESGDGLALAAFRPAGAAGQDEDVISAAVLDPGGSAPVEDPRLSTTYAADGWVRRAGLELWLGGDEDQQLVRRAAGQATGARGAADAGAVEVRAELFRWHSHGRDGAGVYLMAMRR